ncbi:fimbrillin family protein [Alistipes onderdonkii]|uniref:fimbrillin family protein n=1 Tax=Alistipes onderdonkii TaxID=328813 RepID=UPI0036F28A56
MKHFVFFLTIATIALVSCSKDETTGVNQGLGIEFRPSIGKNAITRAVETTNANLQSIYVTAFDNGGNFKFSDEFTKEADPSVFWTAAPRFYFWPADGSQYTFHAYSPASTDLGGTMTLTKTEKKLSEFSPKANINEQKDFIVANATGSKANEASGVALAFKHALSQVQVKAKNANGGYVYKVKGVRIGSVGSKGDFIFPLTDNSWTLDAAHTKANYQSEYTTEISLANESKDLMGADGNAMLIPQQLVAWTPESDKPNTKKGAYLAVKINIVTKDGAQIYPATQGEYDWAAVAIDTNWKPGKKYVYTLDFSNGAGKVDPEKPTPVVPTDPFNPGEDILGSPIKFTVDVTPWEEDVPQNVNM